jgi:hypothetical protein
MLKSWSETNRIDAAASHAHHDESPVAHCGARLNVFQRLARQWDAIHPYNGAQVVKIAGTVDLELCRKAWLDALAALELGVLCLSEESYRYRQMNGEAMYHGVVLCPEGTRLDEWISTELNRPFNADGGVPFRAFVLQEEGHFWMGLFYQHWVADSTSIRMLIREWFVRQFDPASATKQGLRHNAGGYFSLFGPHRNGSRPIDVLLSTLRWHSKFQKVRRIEDIENFHDMSLRFCTTEAPVGLIDQLRFAARAMGATVNDLFLAAIARVCNEHVPLKRRYRRKELAVGTIVDLRPSAQEPLNDVFDLLLGFTSVWCRDGVLGDWNALVETVSRQTRQQKRNGLPLASGLRMAYGIMVGKYFSRKRLIEFYRKRVPLAGANSNVNMNRCWSAKYANGPILDYLRVAPTGPMTPLVFATTTLGNSLSIGLTYREAIIDSDRAKLIADGFVQRLLEIVQLFPASRV